LFGKNRIQWHDTSDRFLKRFQEGEIAILVFAKSTEIVYSMQRFNGSRDKEILEISGFSV